MADYDISGPSEEAKVRRLRWPLVSAAYAVAYGAKLAIETF
jgi:hypothetical protein